MNSKNVVIIEDQYLFAKGLKEIIKQFESIKIAKIVYDASTAMHAVDFNEIHLVFLDLNLNGENGLDVLKFIREKYPDLLIVILSVYQENVLIEKAKKLGADAYLTKDAPEEELCHVLFTLQRGEFFLSEKINFTKVGRNWTNNYSFGNSVLITGREKEVLAHIINGKSSKEIAELLNISDKTVDTHRKNMMRKLKFRKISELVNYAVKNFNF